MKSKRLKKLENNDYCWYCGNKAEDVDHKVPVSKNGPNEISNLVPSCRRCNNAKGNLTVDEFREFLKARAARRSTKHTVVMIKPYGFLFYGERPIIKCAWCCEMRPAHYDVEDMCQDCPAEAVAVIDEFFDGDPLYPLRAAMQEMEDGEPDVAL
jgi:hypothetical protein